MRTYVGSMFLILFFAVTTIRAQHSASGTLNNTPATSPLHGCTVSTTNTIRFSIGGCIASLSGVQATTGGAAWTLAAAQGFDNGPVAPGQALAGSAVIDCTGAFAHTGSCADTVTYNTNSISNQWFFSQGQLVGREYLLSFWDNGHGELFNEEYVMNHHNKHNATCTPDGAGHGCNSPGAAYEEAAVTLFADRNNTFNECLGAFNGTLFNCPDGHIVDGTQGLFVHQDCFPGPQCDYGPYLQNYGAGAYHQFEMWIKANTPNVADGFTKVYLDGNLIWTRFDFCRTTGSSQGCGQFGGVDMTGMQVEAGGWVTKSIWRYPDNSCAASAGAVDPAHGGGSKEIGACTDFTNCVCPPNIPVIRRAIDDIILLQR